MELWELSARERIREAVARYAHLVDRGRIDELVLLFTADGTLEAGDPPPAEGREAIRAFLAGTKSRLAATGVRPLVRHHVSSLTIEVTGPEAATAACYFLVVTERGPDHWGTYRDRFVQIGGRWLFQQRRVRVDGRAADSRFAPLGEPRGGPGGS